ncbi:MAG: hypothetical protein WDN47_04590 [Candidatus Doudnabacteria bacterium]
MPEAKYCGLDSPAPDGLRFLPKTNVYDRNMLAHLTREHVTMPEPQIKEFVEAVTPDMRSEWDAENLCRLLVIQPRQAGFASFSPEFEACEAHWRRDELDHFRMFSLLIGLLTGRSAEAIEAEMRPEDPDYTNQRPIIGQELEIALALAWDEFFTTYYYGQDRALYRALGHPKFLRWFNQVIRDEKLHFDNFSSVAISCHANRASEFPAIIDRLESMELARSESRQLGKRVDFRTFLMDRGNSEQTPREIKRLSSQFRKAITGKLKLAQEFV